MSCCCRCLRLLKILKRVKTYPHLFKYLFVNKVHYEVLHIIINITVFIMIITGVVQTISYHYYDSFEVPISMNNDILSTTRSLYYHECLYFIIVTITTVGYGDIYPTTTLSRMLMIIIMILSFMIIPTLLSDLVKALYSNPLHNGTLSSSTRRYIVICGIVNSTIILQLLNELHCSTTSSSSSSTSLLTILSSLSHKNSLTYDHKNDDNTIDVVILSPHYPNHKVSLLLDVAHVQYHRRVMYFVGSTRSAQDLQRVSQVITKTTTTTT